MKLRYGSNDNKNERGKPVAAKPRHTKKAPMIASLVASVALVTGACTVKDVKVDKEPENKKGDLVAEDKVEKPKTKKIEVFMSEVEVPEENVVKEKPKTAEEAFLSDYGNPEEWCDGVMPEDCIPTKSKSIKEKFEKGEAFSMCDIIVEIAEVNENGIKIDVIAFDDLIGPVPFDGPTFEIPYGSVLPDELELSETKIEKGKKPGEVIITTTHYDCWETDKFSYKKTVKEGDSLPMWAGTSFRKMESPKVTKIDEEGVEVTWNIETLFEQAEIAQPVRIPYGESVKLGEGPLSWEIKAVKGKNSDEAKLIVKNTVSKQE